MPQLWNEAERERVAELLLAGISIGRIAQAFGQTRNVVAGRIYRDRTLHQYAGHRGLRRVVSRAVEVMPPIRTLLPDAGPFACVEILHNVPLVELQGDQCRWPVARAAVVGGFLFCARSTHSPPYCPAHKRLAGAPRGDQ